MLDYRSVFSNISGGETFPTLQVGQPEVDDLFWMTFPQPQLNMATSLIYQAQTIRKSHWWKNSTDLQIELHHPYLPRREHFPKNLRTSTLQLEKKKLDSIGPSLTTVLLTTSHSTPSSPQGTIRQVVPPSAQANVQSSLSWSGVEYTKKK